jgi:hypothetical protein
VHDHIADVIGHLVIIAHDEHGQTHTVSAEDTFSRDLDVGHRDRPEIGERT